MGPRPLRILQVVPTYLPATRYGGPIYSVHGLASALAALHHEVHVFTTNADGPEDSQVPLGEPVNMDGVNVWYFPAGRPRRIYRSLHWVMRLHRCTLGLTSSICIRSFSGRWAAAAACRKFGLPYIVSPRGMMVRELVRAKSPLVKATWITLIERADLEHAAAIHVTADIEAREIEKFGFRLPSLIIIPNGVAMSSESSGPETNPEIRKLCEERRPLILYLGRINWKKNLIELVLAMSPVPLGHLAIVGYDEDNHGRTIVETANSLGLQERVTVLAQPILGRDKEALLARCDLFVLPSLSENFGNTVLEAAIRGKPVVVSEGAGAATLVREHQCGRVCLPNAKSISLAIADILSNLDRARLMGERGRVAALRDYSWSAIGRQMSEAYETIVRGTLRPTTGGDGNLYSDRGEIDSSSGVN
jgi:glycosyltransferase involved in cell wall biosynthesis